MRQEITDFFSAGRRLRASQMKGSILLIEDHYETRLIIEKWAENFNMTLISHTSLRNAIHCLQDTPKCIIIGIDNRGIEGVIEFLSIVEIESPCTISVVVSSNPKKVQEIIEVLPRVTSIIKGQGLEEILSNLLPSKEIVI